MALVWIIHDTRFAPEKRGRRSPGPLPCRNGAAKAGEGAGDLACRVVSTINLSRVGFYGRPARVASGKRNAAQPQSKDE